MATSDARPEGRNSLLAKIHIARKDLALGEDVYRDLLERVTGQRSASGLTDRQLVAVVAELRAKGWQPKAAPRKGRKPRVKAGGSALLAKMEALLADNGRPWSYAEAIARRMFGVEKLEWCDADQLKAVMVALVKDARRREGKEEEA
ncbi:regulatory protein GemA [Nitratidesulfovibrio sp.]|uniref:gp16 family protein n=1 Tax=Nitratidesulfovibrio sp. TaxID=2802297 RepID=UPI00333E866B